MRTRSRILAFVLFSGVLSFTSPTPATAAASAQVTFVDAYAPAADVAIPLDICVDGVTITTLTTAVKGGPFAVPSGNRLITAYEGSDTCSGTPTISSTVRIPDSGAATVVLGWGPDGASAVVFPEPQACSPTDVAQLVLRNAGSAASAPSVWGARSGSGETAQLTATALYGHQASASVFAGAFTDFVVRSGGTDLTNFGTTTLAAGTVTQIYFYGGADGAAGAFSFVFPLATCAPSSTSGGTVADPVGSTGSPTPRPTSAPARPAVPIRTTKPPTYIG